jgi:hypothetical protein
MANISLCTSDSGCIAQFGPVPLADGKALLKIDDNDSVQLPSGSNFFIRLECQDNSSDGRFQYDSSQFAIL